MGKIVAICNQKGGVGKTTTAINLSAAICYDGVRVLLVDMDPQGNCTSGLGIDKKGLEASVYHVLMGSANLPEVFRSSSVPNLTVVPSSIDLTGAEVELVNEMARELRMRNVLYPARDQYDCILIDCPPSLSLLTINALCASDSVLIPLQCEYYALEGLGQLLQTVELVQRHLNQGLTIEGVVMTMADFRTKLSEQVIREARDFFKEKLYKTIIARSVKLSEAPGFGKCIFEYDGSSTAAQNYRELGREFVARLNLQLSPGAVIGGLQDK